MVVIIHRKYIYLNKCLKCYWYFKFVNVLDFVRAKSNASNTNDVEDEINKTLINIIYSDWYWQQEMPNKINRMPNGNHICIINIFNT